MTSSPLYLAIVIVWAIVLVPMLLRRDATDPSPDSLRRTDPTPPVDAAEEDPDSYEPDSDEDAPAENRETLAEAALGPAVPPIGRARVIARRRRRTSGLLALLLGTGIAVTFGYGPWWVLAPPVLLLAGHLALLREAAKVDAERRAAERVRRRRELKARRAAAEAARTAEIVHLRERADQVYDQYADAHLRAAGD
ncbi:divisome protein SepX/GlpR [Salinactinospora qingdaonensis]|uniref:Uncharacterized protein n=1 Tax=Salinactinospora qingdaonensis TaxID=702744 RepID=A0ABP7FLS1_9ACTN